MGKNISLRIEGDRELIEAMKKAGRMSEVRQVVQKNGAALQTGTQQRMAAAYNRGYSTGATRRSTTVKLSDGGLTATVAPHTTYFPYLEKGTRLMSARPTLGPAFHKQSVTFINDLKGLVK
jgi:HK97 gp10 family phage protein